MASKRVHADCDDSPSPGTSDKRLEPSEKRSRRSVQSYRAEYTEKYPCIVRCPSDTNKVRCTMCELDFSVKHGGIDDIKRHVATKNHKKRGSERPNEKLAKFGFGTAAKSPVDYSTTQAETYFVSFLVEHNLPLSAADHAGPLFRKMFPKCQTAQEFKCARTKATAIAKCLAKHEVEDSAKQMRQGPFIIGTDGSQEGGEKHYPIVVRFCDSNGYIQTRLLANPTSTDSSSGQNIFNLLDEILDSLGIDWNKCLSLVCDNAATMTGVNKGVISFVREKAPDVHLAGCVCHLLNLAAKKATKAFQGEFDFDDILRQMSWYMSKSTNRETRLKELQKKCGTPELSVIDHCPTRWLSMGQALRRLLQLWKPLQMFFEEECRKDCKEKESEEKKKRSSIRTRVHGFLKRNTAKLYALFLAFAMESFDILNQELQTDTAKIHVVKRRLEQFYRKLLTSFLKPSALSSGTLLEVEFTAKYNVKDSKDILIGTATKQHLSTVRDKVVGQFMKDVISFYQAACTYMKAKVFPVGEPVWKHAQVADISLKETALFSSLDYFVERFPCLLPREVKEDEVPQEAWNRAKDQLQAEFSDYQSWEVPSHLTEQKLAAEEYWAQILKVKDCNGAVRFMVLPKVMLGILLLPVSNAACERVFSVARRNRTIFRASMGQETTEALLVLKSKGGICHEHTFDDHVLAKCKAATKDSLSK